MITGIIVVTNVIKIYLTKFFGGVVRESFMDLIKSLETSPFARQTSNMYGPLTCALEGARRG